MAEDRNKLEHFKNAVFAEADKKADKIIKQAQDTVEKNKEDLKKSIKRKERAEFSKIDKNTEARMIKEISAKKLESNRNVLLHRQQIADKVFENVQNTLDEFRNSENYKDYLLKLVKSCTEKFPDNKGVVIIGKTDEKYKDMLEKASGLEVQIKPTITLGGLMVSFADINVMLDCTFDSALEEEKENFCNTCQLAL